MKCLMCNDDKEYDAAYFSRVHLKTHNITSLEYYNMFLKQPNDGICVKCGNPTKYISFSIGYRKYCSSKCSNSDTAVLQKKKDSYIEHYGVDHPLKTLEIKSKIISTNLLKYGVKWGLSNDVIKNTAISTNITRYGVDNQFKRVDYIKNMVFNKYGVDNVSKLSSIRDKAKETLHNTYGVLYPLQNAELLKKSKTTLYKNYGVLSPLKSNVISAKYKKTILEKYHVPHIMNVDIIKDKIKLTSIDKYGVDSPMKNIIVSEKSSKNRRDNYWDIFIEKMKYKQLSANITKDDYIKPLISYNVTCNLCNNTFLTTEHNPQRITCGCLKTRSQEEIQIVDFIKNELNINNIAQNKLFNNGGDRYELDIYLPDYNIGIEVDGLYWHSELYKPRLYHKYKTNFFKNMNINIMHIFDHEWKHKKEIVKSIIQAKLNRTKKVYARNCVIREIDSNESKIFLNNNHLQGYVPTSVKLGLFHNNCMVSCMTFSKPRYSTKYEYELVRFCNELNLLCVGGFSKLLSYFVRTYAPNDIISYCDLRYFDSHGYETNGFNLVGITEPNYYYFKQSIIYNRIACQKHKLNKLLSVYDSNKSESENMLNNGFLRIYDCGNKVLVYNNKL